MTAAQALEGPPVDVDAVVDALMAADLSPAGLAAAEAASLGLSFKPPPHRLPVGGSWVSQSSGSCRRQVDS